MSGSNARPAGLTFRLSLEGAWHRATVKAIESFPDLRRGSPTKEKLSAQ